VSRPAVRPGTIDRGVYGTIVVTSVLVIYDGWGKLKIGDAIVVIVGPLVAMVIGHVFAATIADYSALGHRPAGQELLRIVRRESRFLLVCLPAFWGGVAAWDAGGRGSGRTLVLAVVIGVAVGGVVLLLASVPSARQGDQQRCRRHPAGANADVVKACSRALTG
jgi:hypothetical protein